MREKTADGNNQQGEKKRKSTQTKGLKKNI